MGFEGFSGHESILYHLVSPCHVVGLGEFEPIVREEWVPTAHAHRHFHTWESTRAGDAVSGRQLLMWNNDVEISLCRPDEEMDYFFRNGEGDEVVFVHEGSGTLETVFGDCPYTPGDYIVIPRGTTYRFVPEGRAAVPRVRDPGLITIPKRYRNEHGQLMEHAPYYHRDLHAPTELRTVRDRGEFVVKVRVRDGYQTYVLDYHPFDVVGWDGYVYPWTFSIHDFEPITGRIHMPPPSHQTFAGPNFVICSFCPRKLDFDPRRGADPVPPLDLPERGDDLLRRRELLVAQGDRGRVGHASSHGPSPRAAAWPRGEVARHDGDARARGDVRHVPPAEADERSRRSSTTDGTPTRGPTTARRTAPATPTTTPPASPRISDGPSLRLVVDWDATCTVHDTQWMVLEQFGDRAIFERVESELGTTMSYRDVMETEMATVTAPLDEVNAWLVEHVEVRPGFAELVERHRPLVLSGGFAENDRADPPAWRASRSSSSRTASTRAPTAGGSAGSTTRRARSAATCASDARCPGAPARLRR